MRNDGFNQRAGMALLLISCFVSLAAASHQSLELQRAGLPNTAAGHCAGAYIDAFNSGGEEMLRAFLGEYRSPSYLEDHPIDERLAYHERLRGIFGQLNLVKVVLSLEHQLTLLADATETEGALVIRFQLDDEPPHYLAYVTFTGIDHFEVPSDYVAFVATRAAPVNDALRRSTVQSVAESLRDVYVFPAIGQRMADTLLLNQAQGVYDDLTRAGRLADKLTEDALAISNDKHIWVEAQNPMAQASTDPVNRDLGELRRDNYDFREVRVLPGNIGYIKFDMIHDDEEAQGIAAAALAFVARCDALIFDLRDNIGGEWGTAELILGYVLKGGTVFSYSYDREGRRIGEGSVPLTVPGVPFDDDIPVYVLTSSGTGSAAEALAYTLKHMGRATIVGEVTRGAAHPSEEIVVNDYFRVSIPFRRSENTVTGTNWEGVGVIPHITVAAGDALDTAVEDALQRVGRRQ